MQGFGGGTRCAIPWRVRSPRWILVAVVALGLAVAGCQSPTLPLPPPGQPEVSEVSSEGTVTVQGDAMADALVFGLNDRTGRGAIDTATASGNYRLVIEARVGDQLEIWQQLGSEASSPILVRVKK